MRCRDEHEEPEEGRDAQRSGATEQSSGIATSGIKGETDVEGLEDGELLESRALGRWPEDLGKSSLEVSWISFGHGTKCNTCACCGPSSELSAWAWGRTCT